MKSAAVEISAEHPAIRAARALLAEDRDATPAEASQFRIDLERLHAADPVAGATLFALWQEIDRLTTVRRAQTSAAGWRAHEGFLREQREDRIARWAAASPLSRALLTLAAGEGFTPEVRRGFHALAESLTREETRPTKSPPPTFE